jgi:hypothetical protein
MKLTNDGKALLDPVEKGEWKRIPDFPSQAAHYSGAARTTLRKNKRVEPFHRALSGESGFQTRAKPRP